MTETGTGTCETDRDDVPPIGLADAEYHTVPSYRARAQGTEGYEKILEEYAASNTAADSVPDMFISGNVTRSRNGSAQCGIDTSETNTTGSCTITRKVNLPSFEYSGSNGNSRTKRQ